MGGAVLVSGLHTDKRVTRAPAARRRGHAARRVRGPQLRRRPGVRPDPERHLLRGSLFVPVFILSGIVFTSVDPPAWLALVSGLIPLRLPVDLLLGEPIGAVDALVWCSVVLAWLVLSGFLAVRALRGTTRAGTPEVTRSFTGWRPACAWAGRPPPLSPPSARR